MDSDDQLAEQDVGVATGSVCWFHCFAGIAGDMALGSLIDAGADLSEITAILKRLPFGGWELSAEPVLRAGIAATQAVVSINDDKVVRTFNHVLAMVEEAKLPKRVEQRAVATFSLIAEVEGRIHRRPTSQVHFHEVGGHDSIIDVVGTCIALEILEVDEITASSIATGTGTIRTAHGVLPNPSPAVVELLHGIPTWGRDIPVELTTPTGAGFISANADRFGPMPAMTVLRSGFGAGTREIDGIPNCTQVVIGSRSSSSLGDGQPVMQLEVNVDDATGETLAHAVSSLLQAGAHDAWITPIIMKKGRPAHTVSALVDVSRIEPVRQVLMTETGSFGVRAVEYQRWPLARRIDEVEVDGEPVRLKVSSIKVKVEHDDAVSASRNSGLSLDEVLFRAEAAWRQRFPDEQGRQPD